MHRSALRRSGLLAAGLLAAAVLVAPAAGAASPPDFTQYGFPTVVAQTNLAAGAGGSLTYGPISVQIPTGAFTDPVTFELLEGPVANFQKNAPAGTTVISDFAFKVVDTTTNTLVGAFSKPVVFTLTSPSVNAKSQYYNISTAGVFTLNPIPATISGTTLTHPIAAAGVGWAVTSPAAAVSNATTPSTGIPVLPIVGTGFIVLAAGVFLIRRLGHVA